MKKAAAPKVVIEPSVKMNPEVKKKWVKALRSGEYKQAHNILRCEESYCCLGVLCNLYLEEKGIKNGWKRTMAFINHEKPDDPRKYYGIPSGENHVICSTMLPNEVMEWAGLEDANPKVLHDGDGNVHGLTYLNDIENLNFDKIADTIEESL